MSSASLEGRGRQREEQGQRQERKADRGGKKVSNRSRRNKDQKDEARVSMSSRYAVGSAPTKILEMQNSYKILQYLATQSMVLEPVAHGNLPDI